ncbi:LysR family transcriptional regulator [Agaribacter flavus]|uniref:LysR family transcriptional regulator n=1 Tax=Agaribacter flavus TaxID=1902781 RepID=A0ABV7FNB6_9ALTE
MYRPKSTLEQWRILQAVVDYGGYAQAAKALNKSQSSLNHAVTKLQDLLDVKILETVGRKAVLTEAGKALLRRSRDLTNSVSSLEQLAVNINQDWEPEITLALDLAFPRNTIYQALKTFMPESRGSRLRIIDTVLTGTLDAITSASADIVISLALPKGYLGEPIRHIEFVLVCHPKHYLASLPQPISTETLSQHLQIVISDTSDSPKENQGWLKSELRWTVSQFDSAIDLLRQNLGFCWLPLHKVEHLLSTAKLTRLYLQGSSYKQSSAFLVIPKPEHKGPGVCLLEKLILQQREIDLLCYENASQKNKIDHGTK